MLSSSMNSFHRFLIGVLILDETCCNKNINKNNSNDSNSEMNKDGDNHDFILSQ